MLTKRTLIVIAGTLLCGLLLTGATQAMESGNYRLDWFTPLTGSSGGSGSSDNYAINFTIDQTVIGSTFDSDSYEGCRGYWCGGATEHRIYLPLVVCGD